MGRLKPSLVWKIIKEGFMCDKNDYSALINSIVKPSDLCEGKTSYDFCSSIEVEGNRDLFRRMFRSEAERGALQGELFVFLRNFNKINGDSKSIDVQVNIDAINEYKRSCFVGNGRSRGDIAVFESVKDQDPLVMLELKHWSAFQGAPSEFCARSCKTVSVNNGAEKIKIKYSSVDIYDELGRWLNKVPDGWPSAKSENETDQEELSNYLRRQGSIPDVTNISPICLGFFTEVYPIGNMENFENFSFLKSYRNKRAKKINELFCDKQNSRHRLCPPKLIKNFTEALQQAWGDQKTFANSHEISYAYIDQSISELELRGRLHCFAVWPK